MRKSKEQLLYERDTGKWWLPRRKYQLVGWLSSRFQQPRRYFEKMTKERLYAIYYNERRKWDDRVGEGRKGFA